MTMARTAIAATVLGLFAACGKPDYPKCEKDEQCKKGEFCVNAMCQLCRGDGDCSRGQACVKGRCERIPGFCASTSDCEKGQGCKAGKCTTCDANEDCGAEGRCRLGTCLQPGDCQSNEDCAETEECQAGRCAAPPSLAGSRGPCDLQPVRFDFNEYLLTTDATAALAANAECLKKAGEQKARVDGSCDPRGTEDYNLALGDKRARGVIEHLGRLGVDAARLRPVSRGKLDAKGTDEAGWAQDRHADFVWE